MHDFDDFHDDFPSTSRRVTWPVGVDPRGRAGPTRGQASGPHWRRTGLGLYVPTDVPLTTPQRIVEAAKLLPSDDRAPGGVAGGVTGWGALHWLGGGWFEGSAADGSPLDVDLACSYRRPWPGVAICEEGLDPQELIEVDGVRVTVAVRSVCFMMRRAPSLVAAVRAFDMAAHNDLVSLEEVHDYASEHRGWTGIPQCRDALLHCDENAWSPREVDMRLMWTREAGLARPLTNAPVFDLQGRHIGTPDLLDPVVGVIGEYDGSLHLAGPQRSIDVRREARFRDVGLEVVTMLASDLPDHQAVVGRLRAAYARAEPRARTDRPWTITPPQWWTPTSTVTQRRALTPEQRRRFLAIRRQASKPPR
ncbi:hypothetical protein ncot_01830 [Nocardioides sp. JQ2195]|nr:hypothetical protein ncot_01830 [Nocardioides sp. JQ2195]